MASKTWRKPSTLLAYRQAKSAGRREDDVKTQAVTALSIFRFSNGVSNGVADVLVRRFLARGA